jgi:hypothetical protein
MPTGGRPREALDEAPSQTGDDEVTDMTIVTSDGQCHRKGLLALRRADAGGACFNAPVAQASWCAVYKTGGNNCGFANFAQCQAAVSGVGDSATRLGWQSEAHRRASDSEGLKAKKEPSRKLRQSRVSLSPHQRRRPPWRQFRSP